MGSNYLIQNSKFKIQNSAFDVVGLGYCCVDYTGFIEKFSGVDEKIPILKFHREPGGPVANALVTLSRLGAKALFIGKTGTDEDGDLIQKGFENEKVSTKGLLRSKGHSQFAFVFVEKKGDTRTIFWTRRDVPQLMWKEVNRRDIASAQFLILDGHEPEAALPAAKYAKSKGVRVSFDAGGEKPGTKALLPFTDVVVMPESHMRKLTGEKNAQAGAKKISKMGPSFVVVTCGRRGCVCAYQGRTFFQPAFRVRVVDTTGAGDVFHGGLVFALFKGFSPRECVRFASAVSAIKCMRMGGRAGIPALSEVKVFLDRKGTGL